jgi:hypothetical protein
MSSMPHKTQIEFVCYEEGGVIDLQRAFDELLPQTLLRISAESESESESKPEPDSVTQPFQPSFQPLQFHHAVDELLTQKSQRFSFPKRSVSEVEAIEEVEEIKGEQVEASSLPVPVSTSLPAPTRFYSFHDELLIRARDRSVERRRETHSRAKYWRALLIWTIIEMVAFGGIGCLVAGFLAIYQGLSLDRTSRLILLSGLAVAAVVLIVKILRSGPKPLDNAATA